MIAVDAESPRPHCKVTGRMNERKGADGRDYALSFELRLPDEWNGRFVHQFNGGNDGEVKPAIGPLLGGNKGDTALSRGYAVVSSDAGHDGKQVTDAGLAGGARFGFDPQARRDYGYGAVAALNPVAEQLVERYYREPIAFSYGVGSSNGGRHAMVAAARMPDAFDGLLIGYPGFNLPRAALQHALDVQSFRQVSDDLKTAFSREELGFVAGRVLAACDALDGLEDAMINDVDACQTAFDPQALIGEPYRGIRPAPGYPAQPDHTEKATLFRLLDAGRNAGVELTESMAMWPGASVSGLYIGHPDSYYFGVAKVERDQVADYAARKGMPVDEAERWLAPVLNYVPGSAPAQAAE
ncbi:MAG TPA: tannase/feruloyl esterase family alpha/beta hydrolase [Rhizobiaceae bacterium]|nr:tannase/feruloyl esterase family alpha/beta hydrolase [Rhizobiaceae bacterium]